MQFYKNFFFASLLCIGGGWLSGLITREGINDWYNHLIHPTGTPPNIIFPIVWSILYLLMAISLALVLSSPSKNKGLALLFFGLQLFFNFSWSWLFFGLRAPFLGLIDIILLWLSIAGTIFSFKRHSILSAYLLIPYLLWVTYAAYLNVFIWMKNP